MPFCSSSAVRCVAGSRFEPGSVFGVFEARICLCRRVLVCWLVAWVFLKIQIQQYHQHFHLHLIFGKIIAQFIISMHIHPMNPQSWSFLHLTFHYCQLLGSSVDLLTFFFFFSFNLWSLYPTTSVCTGWHSPWLAESSLSTWPVQQNAYHCSM